MSDEKSLSEETSALEQGIRQLNAGDSSVRGELLNIASQRLLRLSSRMCHEFREVENIGSDTILEHASTRLYEALHDQPIRDVRHFYRIAAVQIRRELVRFANQAVRQGSTDHPKLVKELQQWADFHQSIDSLPEAECEVFELVWYHDMTHEQISELIGISTKEVRRFWRAARLRLHDLLEDLAASENVAGFETN